MRLLRSFQQAYLAFALLAAQQFPTTFVEMGNAVVISPSHLKPKPPPPCVRRGIFDEMQARLTAEITRVEALVAQREAEIGELRSAMPDVAAAMAPLKKALEEKDKLLKLAEVGLICRWWLRDVRMVFRCVMVPLVLFQF